MDLRSLASLFKEVAVFKKGGSSDSEKACAEGSQKGS